MVLSALLFLLYIDDLCSFVPVTVKVALFADDVSLINSHHKKLVAVNQIADGPFQRRHPALTESPIK